MDYQWNQLEKFRHSFCKHKNIQIDFLKEAHQLVLLMSDVKKHIGGTITKWKKNKCLSECEKWNRFVRFSNKYLNSINDNRQIQTQIMGKKIPIIDDTKMVPVVFIQNRWSKQKRVHFEQFIKQSPSWIGFDIDVAHSTEWCDIFCSSVCWPSQYVYLKTVYLFR